MQYRTLGNSGIEASVVALIPPEGDPLVDPGPHTQIVAGSTLVMIGGPGAQAEFIGRFGV